MKSEKRRKISIKNCCILAAGCLMVIGLIIGGIKAVSNMFTESKQKDEIMTLHNPADEEVTDTLENTEISQDTDIEEPVIKRVIMIDPGHGGYDGGAVSVEGVHEKEINLAIALKIQAILEEYDIEVLMTRDGDEVQWPAWNDTDLQMRLDMLHASDAEFMVSIHCNSTDEFPDDSYGIEVYMNENQSNSVALAETVNDSLMMIDDQLFNRGVKEGSFYHILSLNYKPVILIETGFLTHYQEGKELNDDAFQANLAYCIAQGILNYLGM